MRNSRELAVHILYRVETDQAYVNLVLDTELQKLSTLDSRDKALVTELVYGVCRWQKTLDWYLDQVCKKPIRQTRPWLRHILRIGAYQLLMLDRIPPSAAINESVKLAGKYSRKVKLPAKTAKGFVNAALRQLERNRDNLRSPETIPQITTRLAVQYSFPEWLIARWIQRLGKDGTEESCRINNQVAPLTLRLNTLKTSLDDLKQRLASQVQSLQLLPGNLPGLVISGSPPIRELTPYQNSECIVQNASSMLIPLILDPQPGEHILEACAGSGIKTTHIGELMNNQGNITAVDIHEGKLQHLRENCQRWGITIVQTYCGDMTNTQALPGCHIPGKKGFQRILVDAPCSGLGVLRKHPETKWTRKECDIKQLQQLQLGILTHAAIFLHSDGGVLVYSTCTTEPEENEEIISTFLKTVNGFRIEPLHQYIPEELHHCMTSEGFLRIDPPQQYFDGFFSARLFRVS